MYYICIYIYLFVYIFVYSFADLLQRKTALDQVKMRIRVVAVIHCTR